MDTKSQINLSIVLYTDEYKKQTLDLLRVLWANKDEEQCREYFKWKYEKNPFTKSPLIFLALFAGKVIGVLGHVVQRFYINGTLHNVCTPVDGVVHSDYRMHGVYLKMSAEAIKKLSSMKHDYDFKLFFNASSNPKSAPGLVKLSWQGLYPKSYGYKISLLSILQKSFFPDLKKKKDNLFIEKRNYSLEICNELKYNEIILLRKTNRKLIEVLKDSHFYLWRFGYQKEQYKFVYFYQHSRLVSYLILREYSSGKFSIEEYGFNDIKCLRTILIKAIKSLRISFLRFFIVFLPFREELIFLSLGFIFEKNFIFKLFTKKRTSAYIRHVGYNVSTSEIIINRINCLNYKYWRIFHSDVL